MRELIDRQAAIDILKQFKPEIIPYEKARSYVEETIDTMYNRIEELPTIQPEPQWIPVSERLPEEDGKYMVTIHGYGWNGKTFTSVSVAECIGKRWVGNNGVIAWIPLPKPYEGEGEQE